MATERLRVLLQMEAGQYKREARDAAKATGGISRQAKSASQSTGGLQRRMTGFGSALRGAAVVGGILAVGRGLFSAAEAAERSASAMAITEQVIRETGGAANVTSTDVENLSRRLSAMTGVQDEVVQEGANVLLTFKNLRNEAGEGNDVFDRTSELMLDVATVMNSDAKGAAIQLGKALNDPVANMGALSRSGLTFTAQQKDQIKTLAESNNLLEAQKIILSELESQLGGVAAESADASDRIRNALGNIGESAGTGLLPFLEDLADGLAIASGMSPQVRDLSDTIKEIGEVNLSDLFQVGEFIGATDFRDAMTEILATADLTDEGLRELATGGMAQLREEFDLSGRRAEILAEIIEAKLASGLTDAEQHARDARNALDDLDAADLGDVEEELVDTQISAEDAARAVDAIESALRRMADPAFRAADNQFRLNDAVARFNDLAPDASAQEYQEAVLDVVEAQIDVNESARDLPNNMQGVEDAFIGAATQAGLLEDDVRPVFDLLEQFDGRISTWELKVAFSASSQARELIESGGGFGGGSVTVETDDLFRHRGGPGTAGVPYVIRPDEEIFVPSGNGQFLLNDQVMSALRGLSGGRSTTNNFNNTTNIPIQSTGDQNVDAQLVGAVASVLRRMENR